MERIYPQRRLSISNIAWPGDKDDEALNLLTEVGFDGIELAPGKVFGDLHTVSLEKVRAYRSYIESKGLAVSALQAILFGVQDAHLFKSPESRERMAAHVRRIAEIAGTLGARACVFGSPALRDPGALPPEEAFEIAKAFLRDVAPEFATQNVELCFEANPALYQCRFVTHTEEAFNLVRQVGTPGVAMQLDTGTIFINGEDPEIIRRMDALIGHFHISEPNLVPTGTSGVDHARIARALKHSTYPHWLSIEMKATDNWREAIRGAYILVDSLYRGTDNIL